MHCLGIGQIHLFNVQDVLRTSMRFAKAHALISSKSEAILVSSRLNGHTLPAQGKDICGII